MENNTHQPTNRINPEVSKQAGDNQGIVSSSSDIDDVKPEVAIATVLDETSINSDNNSEGEHQSDRDYNTTALANAGYDNLILFNSLPADENPAVVYLASLSKRSQRTMQGDLNIIALLLSGGRCTALSLNWGLVRYQHAAAVRAVLAERYTHTTVNRMISALRGVLKAAWRLGQLPTEEYHRAIDLPAIKGETLPRGRALPMGELRALFSTCATDPKPNGARDVALLAVLYGAGLRRSEAVALDLSDYEFETGALRVRAGKGNKQRVVYVTHGGKAALETWLRVRGESEGPLFLPITKGGNLIWRRLNNQSVLDILQKRVQQSGTKKCSPHDFRRSFISDLLDAGADITTVQKLAGHANVTTTARYDRRGEATKQKAAELLHVPFSE